MVKGTTRRVMVVRATEGGIFEQAFFLLKEDSLEKQGITERQILEEAKRLAEGCWDRPRKPKLHPVAWTTIGAASTGLVWLITALVL